MATRTILQETDATASSTGVWSSTTLPGTLGTCKFINTAGATFTFTLAANHGFSGGALIGYGRGDSTTGASVSVDGVTVQPVWSMKFGNIFDANYLEPRILSHPFALNPAKGTAQTITLTTGTGLNVIDGIELYQPAAQVAGRLTSFGHSMLYGVTNQSTLGPQAGRFTALFASYLAGTKYLGAAAWTDDNQGVPSEDLTNGGYKSGQAGSTPFTAAAMTQYSNTQYYNNTAIFTPGWMRAEAGDAWPTATPELGVGLMTTAAQYNMAGVAQWWARAFPVGLIMHSNNDRGYGAIYDAGLAIPVAAQDATPHTTAPAAGAGYAIERWKQRLRELLIRAQLAITPAPRIYVLGSTNITNGGAHSVGDLDLTYDAATQAVLSESWVANAYFVSPYAAMTGFPSNVSGADIHPNTDGHQAIFRAIRDVHDRLSRQYATAANRT